MIRSSGTGIIQCLKIILFGTGEFPLVIKIIPVEYFYFSIYGFGLFFTISMILFPKWKRGVESKYENSRSLSRYSRRARESCAWEIDGAVKKSTRKANRVFLIFFDAVCLTFRMVEQGFMPLQQT
jgi:hypothetical protein